MTRKCALCKESNYKNNYSFFSAPKNPETRRKWQVALGIENYTVTDDTYVCSRHFRKDDIITHWVSGVPPQVIKIKYKKCRLRPGAVPNGNFHSISDSQSEDDEDTPNRCDIGVNDLLTFKKEQSLDLLHERETLVISKSDYSLSDSEDNKNINACYQAYSKLQDYAYDCEKNYESNNVYLSKDMDNEDTNISAHSSKLENLKSERKRPDETHDNNRNVNVFTETIIESIDINREESQVPNEPSLMKASNKMTACKRYDSSKEDRTSMETWGQDVVPVNSYLREKSVDSNSKPINDLYIDARMLKTLSYDHSDTQNRPAYIDNGENEILFEDFLEVCAEVPVPRGWSCLVTSKGHSTTVVYLCMSVTKNGLPFVEKQVFLRSDMVLHCVAANREIDPLAHNLVKEGERIKVKSLLDIEELIDEFDRRAVCQGIYDSKDHEDMTKVAYKDGIKWRHTACSLIVNSDSSRCTKCAILSRTLLRKSRRSLNYDDPAELVREKRGMHTLRRIRKRINERDRSRKCIKIFRK